MKKRVVVVVGWWSEGNMCSNVFVDACPSSSRPSELRAKRICPEFEFMTTKRGQQKHGMREREREQSIMKGYHQEKGSKEGRRREREKAA